MSRSGYVEDYGDDDPLAHGRWRAAVKSAFRGKRGQAFLREMLAALDAMPEKRLGALALVTEDGCSCALGVVACARGMRDRAVSIDARFGGGDEYAVSEHSEAAADMLGIARAMAQEIAFTNDEGAPYMREPETPEQRWQRMREWVAREIQGGGQ